MLAAADRGTTDRRLIDLPTGRLSVEVHDSVWPLDSLCGFAARDNPKRGFLVVSKVLGRHWPARPSAMRAAANALAMRVPAGLPGPVLVVGLAETAICLAQTVHEELQALTGREDILFIHSTRQTLDHPLLCRFQEAHSHATAHLIYWPALPDFVSPRSLILVDDELSTGATFTALAEALLGCWPGVETICTAALTDWSDREWQEHMPRPVSSISVLQGRLGWTRASTPINPVSQPGALGRLPPEAPNFGRLGLRAAVAPPPLTTPKIEGLKLGIVGTGEFTYPPFKLAERMEKMGVDVVVQATSRSPARIGGAIASALAFADNYGTGVPNYLYNADAADGRTTWICHETGARSIDPSLVQALGAELVGWVP